MENPTNNIRETTARKCGNWIKRVISYLVAICLLAITHMVAYFVGMMEMDSIQAERERNRAQHVTVLKPNINLETLYWVKKVDNTSDPSNIILKAVALINEDHWSTEEFEILAMKKSEETEPPYKVDEIVLVENLGDGQLMVMSLGAEGSTLIKSAIAEMEGKTFEEKEEVLSKLTRQLEQIVEEAKSKTEI